MILLTDEEIPYGPDNDYNEYYGDIGARDKAIFLEGAKAQLKKVEEWLITLLDDPELQEHRGAIGFIGLTLRGERLKGQDLLGGVKDAV